MVNPQTDVLVIGRCCVDRIAVTVRYPEEDTKVPVERLIVEGGGQGATAACCIRRLGGSVRYVGCVGEDGGGRFCLERLAAFGVDTGLVQVVPAGKTPTAFIAVTRGSGRRTIFYEPSTLPRFEPQSLSADLFEGVAAVLLDPETTYLVDALPPCARGGPPLIYDAERWREGMDRMMQRADYFVPSRGFLDDRDLALSGRTFAERFHALSGRIAGRLIVTRGHRGACFEEEGRLWEVPAPAIAVRDSIGAGDNFHAALTLALSRGQSCAAAVGFAVAVASLSCREYGGREGLPTFHEAEAVARGLAVRPFANP